MCIMHFAKCIFRRFFIHKKQAVTCTCSGRQHHIAFTLLCRLLPRHLGHVSDGYTYMISLGYDEVAKICLTHSFNNQTTKEYIGKFDVFDEELNLIKNTLAKVDMSDYDRLIQLCDSLAGSEGVLDIEERMGDVKQRYGYYPQEKWDSNIRLKIYFEEKAGKDIYEIVDKTFRL